MVKTEETNGVLIDDIFSDVSRFEIEEPPEDDKEMGRRQYSIENILAHYRQHLQEKSVHHLGYPFNLELEFGLLTQFQNLHINNLGDPFIESNYGIHSRPFEVAVLDWFARIWELPKDNYWGYITNGGTEGNLHGLLVGRELFPNGIIYASHDSHYSVFKAAKMFRVECIKINTSVSGEMDYADFRSKLLLNVATPAIVNVNIGTTMKGAIDDIDDIVRTLEYCGFKKDRYYIHCDGALAGLMMAFIKQAPKLTFMKPIGSISVSGHKLIGCPMPCGVVMTRLENIDLVLSTNVEYVASRDATITGSRNGHAPLFLWYSVMNLGHRGISIVVDKCIKNAQYLKCCLKGIGVSAFLNDLSITVIFERPADDVFVRKWQLACQGNISHVVVMTNVTIEMLNRFVKELAENRNNLLQKNEFTVPCVAADIGQENCLCDVHGIGILRSRI